MMKAFQVAVSQSEVQRRVQQSQGSELYRVVAFLTTYYATPYNDQLVQAFQVYATTQQRTTDAITAAEVSTRLHMLVVCTKMLAFVFQCMFMCAHIRICC